MYADERGIEGDIFVQNVNLRKNLCLVCVQVHTLALVALWLFKI